MSDMHVSALGAPALDHPNVTLLKDGYTAVAKGDMDFVCGLLAENVVHRVLGHGPLSGEYRTPEEVLGLYVRMFELSGGTFRAEPYAFMANEEYGAALVQTYAERPGRVLCGRSTDLFTIRGGRITEIRTVPEDQYADDAFWS